MILLRDPKAQSTIEFTFAVVAIMFLTYGMVSIFRWAGMDLANRRVTQDTVLASNANAIVALSVDGNEDTFLPMAAVYHGGITNGNQTQ